jgi:hypothetical protein
MELKFRKPTNEENAKKIAEIENEWKRKARHND